MGEIYKITNSVNGKIYIGKTKRKTSIRWAEHIHDAKRCPKKNIPLHKAIVKYGEDKFIIDIIEKNINNNDLDYLEQFYIKKYNSTDSLLGYNATKGGDGGKTSGKLTEEDVAEIRKMLSHNVSISIIAKQFSIHKSTIYSINSGKAWYDDDIKYPIKNTNLRCIGVPIEVYRRIVSDLLGVDLTIDEIANKYQVSSATVYNINKGAYCYNSDNEYYNNIYQDGFPIRKTKAKIICNWKKVFYEILFTNKSILQIEKDNAIAFGGLRGIVLGTRRKELTVDYLLPMRDYIKENQKIYNQKYEVNNNEIRTNS